MEEITGLTVHYNKKPCYNIVFHDSFDTLCDELIPLYPGKRKFCIITDSNVEKLYLTKVINIFKNHHLDVIFYSFPSGEENKNLATVQEIYRFLIENRMTRKDILIALGGGVVGDMTGYAAATYLRGVDFIQIPTTLLSQVDSSIGGKTGVDFENYKNMVGAFHMPRLVYMNLATLDTLDERQYASGFAEIMKHGLIKDASYYEWLLANISEINDRESGIIKEMVYRSCLIKKDVVEKDPKEQGERALLNFGHTLGHAIEKSFHFKLLHGECVALGCVCAAYISFQKNYIKKEEYLEVRDMFVPFKLPISMNKVNVQEILNNTKNDKKNQTGILKFILLKKIGNAFVDTTVTEQEMADAVKEIIYE